MTTVVDGNGYVVESDRLSEWRKLHRRAGDWKFVSVLFFAGAVLAALTFAGLSGWMVKEFARAALQAHVSGQLPVWAVWTCIAVGIVCAVASVATALVSLSYASQSGAVSRREGRRGDDAWR